MLPDHDSALQDLLIKSIEPEKIQKVQCILGQGINMHEYDLTSLLLQYGANPESLLSLVAENGHLDCLRLTMEYSHPDLNEKTEAMIAAARAGHREVVSFFLDNGVSADACHNKALIAAAAEGNNLVVKLLLDRGVDPNLFPPESPTFGLDSAPPALVVAARHGNASTVKMLLDWGADIHILEDQALMEAIIGGDLSTVQHLLGHGANVKAQNHKAIHHAASMNEVEIAKLLVGYGASIKVGLKTLKNFDYPELKGWLKEVRKSREEAVLLRHGRFLGQWFKCLAWMRPNLESQKKPDPSYNLSKDFNGGE